MVEMQRVTVSETDARVSFKQVSGAPQGTGCEPVVRRKQDGVVTVRPVEQAFVVRRDVPFIDGVNRNLDSRVARRDLACDLRAVIGGGVVDDEDPRIDSGLVV